MFFKSPFAVLGEVDSVDAVQRVRIRRRRIAYSKTGIVVSNKVSSEYI